MDAGSQNEKERGVVRPQMCLDAIYQVNTDINALIENIGIS